jgi:ankyrin repeat protein
MKTAPKMNPCEELIFLAEENGDYDEFKEHIETYGVRGTTPPAGKTGEIYISDLEKTLLRIPAHKYDAKLRVVELLLSYNLSASTTTEALKRAVSKSQIQTIRLLLDYGADANPIPSSHPSHHTPLEHAAAAGDLDAIDALIAAGADINLAPKAVNLAAANGRTKTLLLLIEMGFPVDTETLRYPALLSNNPSTIEAARKLGAQYTGTDFDDEDLQECHKTIAYLRSLGLQPTDPEID